jgi:hypothetical protein
MEDKAPFLPDGSEFKASYEDDDESETKKKKKKRFSDILEILLPKKTDKISEADTETQEDDSNLKKLFKNIFGSVFSVEKQEFEKTSDDDVDNFTSKILNKNVILPIYSQDESEVDQTQQLNDEEELTQNVGEEDEQTVANNQNGDVLLDEYSDTEGQPLLNEAPDNSDFGLEQDQPNHNKKSEDSQLIEERKNNDFGSLVMEDSSYSDEKLVNNINLTTELGPIDVEDSSLQKPKKAHNQDGATAMGSVLVESLSRSQNEKLKKQAEKFKKEVDQINSKRDQDEMELNKFKIKNKKQINQLRQKRQQPQPETRSGRRDNFSQFIEQTRPAESVVPQLPEKNSYYDTKQKNIDNKELPKYEFNATEGSYEDTNIEKVEQAHQQKITSNEVLLKQIEKAVEQDIPLEKYYESRHEAKDAPTVSDGTVINRVKTDVSNKLTPHFTTQEVYQNTKDKDLYKLTPLYKNAIKQGAMAGIIVLVSFLIIIFVWSLLR